MMFHIENAAGNHDSSQHSGSSFTQVAFGQYAHHQFRRFIVVTAIPKESYCYCWYETVMLETALMSANSLAVQSLPTAAGVLRSLE